MVGDTRRSRRAREDEKSNPSGLSTPSPVDSEKTGLRRSSRERLVKNSLVGSPSSSSSSPRVKRSDRDDIRSPKKPEEESKKCVTPSPLRRSNRGKSTSSPRLKASDVSSSPLSTTKKNKNKRKKSQKEKSVRQLNLETEQMAGGRRDEVTPVKTGMKRGSKFMSSNNYKALYGKKKKIKSTGHSKKQEKEDKFSHGERDKSPGDFDRAGESGGISIRISIEKEMVGDKESGKEVSGPGGRPEIVTRIINVEPDISPANYSKNKGEKVKEPEPVDCLTRGTNAGDLIPSAEATGLMLPNEGTSSPAVELFDASYRLPRRKQFALEEHFTRVPVTDSLHQGNVSPRSLQSVDEQRTCVICKLGETTLFCEGKGCRRSYHLTCLDPPMDEDHVGGWHCPACVEKKLKHGVHSVSEGVESIWDSKNVHVLDIDGMRDEREFFIKYKGLAHIHNRWIPERELPPLDAPGLIAKFDRNSQDISWKQEWTIPHQLLQKRNLTANAGGELECRYEWLVKWSGLDYSHSTWELDNSSFFTTPDGQALIKDYESQHNGDSLTVDKCPDSSRFREYWVPVEAKTLQLEQYCATLISNSTVLYATHKSDCAGALHQILLSNRKCCDHPYTVDTNTRDHLSKCLQQYEYLDFGIKASGKFHFLDMMLSKIKDSGLNVVILLQDFVKDSVGDLLEDFLRQRFGVDSFERIVHLIQKNKKAAAIEKFNNNSKTFVMLIETQACSSSIKLNSVHAIIIFGSDWNPMHDMKLLQKLTLDSPSKKIPVFRLYVAHTLEEKVLILAKQGRNLDKDLQNKGRNIAHMLLMWGASHQFQSLDEFHRNTDSSANALSNMSYLKDSSLQDAIQEIFQIISPDGNDTVSRRPSIITNAEIVGVAYHTVSPLPAELRIQTEIHEGESHSFWTKLLEGRRPEWKFISASTHRTRKKAQFFGRADVTEDATRKRRRVGNSIIDLPSPETESADIATPRLGEGNDSVCGDSSSTSPSEKNFLEVLQNNSFDEEQKNLCEAQKSLHLSLKPGISQLCKILQLTGKSEVLVKEFLEYMISHHNVSSDSPTMVQAFQISLVWTVASLRGQKIDHKQSVALAKQHLNFNCRKYEAEFAYLMLTCFKTIFAYRTGKFEEESPSSKRLYRYARNDVVRCVNQIQKKCQKKLQKLTEKREQEKERIICGYEENKLKIQKGIRMESMVIRACCAENSSMRLNSLRKLEVSSAKKLQVLENEKSTSLKNLESEDQAARTMIQEKEARWLGAVKTLVCPVLFGKTLPEELDMLELLKIKEDSPDGGVDNTASITQPSIEVTTTDVPVKAVQLGDQEMVIEPSVPLNVTEKEAQLEVPVAVTEMQPDTVSAADDGTVNVGSPNQQLPEADVTNVTDVEIPSSETEPSRREAEAYNNSMGLDRQESPNIAVIQDPPPRELSPINSSSVQPEITVPPNQDQEASDANQQNSSEALEHPVSSQPVDDTSAQSQNVHDATVTEPAAQVDVLPSSVPLARDNNSSGGVSLSTESQIIESAALNQVPRLPVEPAASNPPLSSPPIIMPSPVSSLVPNGLPPPMAHFSNPRAIQPMVAEFNNLNSSLMHGVSVSPPVYIDPLQKEMDRLCTEFSAVCKSHEDMTLHLKSEREKEIEEALAKINQKYDLKHKEIEATFLTKRIEFDDRINKVRLNKILAEAFRNKCMEIRVTGKSGARKDFNSNASLQMGQQPLQQPLQRPALIGTSSAVSPPVRQQTRPPELNPHGASIPFAARNPLPTAQNTFVPARNFPMPTLQDPVAPPGAITAARNFPPHPQNNVAISIPVSVGVVSQNTPPPAQVARPSNASPVAVRPLQVNDVSYTNTRSLSSAQNSNRASAPPHLRRGGPTQPQNFSTPSSSVLPSAPQLPPAPTQQANHVDRALRPETTPTVVLPNISNSGPAFGSQRGQSSQVTPANFPLLPNVETAFNQLNIAAAAFDATKVNGSTSTREPAELVYLSDDD